MKVPKRTDTIKGNEVDALYYSSVALLTALFLIEHQGFQTWLETIHPFLPLLIGLLAYATAIVSVLIIFSIPMIIMMKDDS